MAKRPGAEHSESPGELAHIRDDGTAVSGENPDSTSSWRVESRPLALAEVAVVVERGSQRPDLTRAGSDATGGGSTHSASPGAPDPRICSLLPGAPKRRSDRSDRIGASGRIAWVTRSSCHNG